MTKPPPHVGMRSVTIHPYVLGIPVRRFRNVVLSAVCAMHVLSSVYFLSVSYLMLNLTPFEAKAMRAYATKPSAALFLAMATLHAMPYLKPLCFQCRARHRRVNTTTGSMTERASPAVRARFGVPPNVSMALGHLLEIASETWIAAQMAHHIVERRVAFFYAMALVSNCLITTWALLFRSSGLKKTLICLLDACLSFLLSAGVPLFRFIVPLVEYKFYGTGDESHDFEWLARSLTSVRTLIVWTPIQPLMVIVPSIMNFFMLQTVAKRVRRTKGTSWRNIIPIVPPAAVASPAGSAGPSLLAGPVVLASSMVPEKGAATPPRRSSASNSIQSFILATTQAFSWEQEHKWVMRVVLAISISWGVVVFVVSILAEHYRDQCPEGCIYDSATWYTRSCNCIYYRWTCNASNYDNDLDAQLSSTLLGPNLVLLHIRKCGLRGGLAADTMRQFQSLYGFHFEFTSMTEWNISSDAFPDAMVLAQIRHSPLDHVPIALQQPSTNLRSIFIVGSPLRAIPDSILQNWQHLNSLWLSSTNLTEFPLPVLQMDGLEVLALDSNQISTIPPRLHLLPHLYWVYLESNNISTFPDALVTARTGVYLYLNHNPIEFIADDVVAQLNPKFVGISSTLFCKHRQLPLLCETDCSATCSRPDWGNFFCDPKCNSTECFYDKGDCAF